VCAVARIPGYVVTADYTLPFEEVISGTGSFFDTARAGALRAARIRGFTRLDGDLTVAIRLVEWMSNGAASGATRSRRTLLTLATMPSTPGSVVSRVTNNSGATTFNIAFARGRVEAEMLFEVYGQGQNNWRGLSTTVQSIAASIADQQFQRLELTPDLSTESISLASEQRVMLIATIATVIGIQMVAGLAAWLRDPSARQPRPVGPGRPPNVVEPSISVERQAPTPTVAARRGLAERHRDRPHHRVVQFDDIAAADRPVLRRRAGVQVVELDGAGPPRARYRPTSEADRWWSTRPDGRPGAGRVWRLAVRLSVALTATPAGATPAVFRYLSGDSARRDWPDRRRRPGGSGRFAVALSKPTGRCAPTSGTILFLHHSSMSSSKSGLTEPGGNPSLSG
jgi:hypothetical protein